MKNKPPTYTYRISCENECGCSIKYQTKTKGKEGITYLCKGKCGKPPCNKVKS